MKFSATMQAAVALARRNGGKLARHPGGFWAAPGPFDPKRDEWHGAQTVDALVERGALKFTRHETTNRGWRFAVEAELTDQAPAALIAGN